MEDEQFSKVGYRLLSRIEALEKGFDKFITNDFHHVKGKIDLLEARTKWLPAIQWVIVAILACLLGKLVTDFFW